MAPNSSMFGLQFDSVPVFPLGAFVLPDGLLPLRIFEPRYVQMLEECVANGTGFVVATLESGTEIDPSATTRGRGCMVEVDSVEETEPKVYKILVQGRFRVDVSEIWRQSDGLQRGKVELIAEPEQSLPTLPEHEILVSLLNEILNQVRGPMPYKTRRTNDARWVAYRLIELLPIESDERERLSSMDNAHKILDDIQKGLDRWVTIRRAD
ncbi:MAG: LON peptidase substrate-binding domain-containing protein [Gammaproteobacteria bacterium]|nr:LON peptidase substrate-binding domain-containing protein [Gammaproteobacteria bacterium]